MLPERSRTTLSGMPSPVRSARNGVLRKGTPVMGDEVVKVPSPLPSSTLTRVVAVGGDEVGLAVAVEVRHGHRADRQSRLAKVCCGWKVPSPLPSSTLTVLSP